MESISASDERSTHVAIVGMAGRFPGSEDIDGFWASLCRGQDSIRVLSEAELVELGVPRHRFTAAGYVRAHGVLSESDGFDAPFFGYSARDAEITDPQHRLFLECAWSALENAGYDPERHAGPIGVYAGAGWSSYLLRAIQADPALLDTELGHQLLLGNEKDHLATRVSYKLDLRGPGLTIQTACSTSLVAVVTAYQALLTFDCDMALAGGVSVTWPQEGYVYQVGGILSPDGRCRAFDASARGTVLGSGAGVVVMKRLQDALADGDHIYAVIRGAALDNDGGGKAGYTAPSVEGQARVIVEAQRIAGVGPESISFIETHGTGTELGDPIEAQGLLAAFRAGAGAGALRRRSCALGAVKTNIGHLDAAAGIAGLIKTALALHHRQIPPSLHFESLNPQIELADSPFYVNTALAPWDSGGRPRRAGVSSFGLGGTNAHVIVEEAPARSPAVADVTPQLVLLSARTAASLERASRALADHLADRPDLALADVAYTLQVGRRPFAHRALVRCPDAAAVVAALRAPATGPGMRTATAKRRVKGAIFAFTGQGTQQVHMARALYRDEPRFRRHAERCFDILAQACGLELRPVIYPTQASDEAHALLAEPSRAQPAVFTIEYALAQMWMELGVEVQGAIGHSLGEYAAATIAGVWSLEDALCLVAERGRLLQALPRGAMLAVPLPEAEVAPLLGGALSLAAINEPRACVVSGPPDAVAALHDRLGADGTSCRYLDVSRAFHSAMLDPVLAEFEARVAKVRLHAPAVSYVSTLTADWITAAEATDPRYWVRHLRERVRFADGLARILADTDGPILEIGPGRTLTQIAKRHPARAEDRLAIASLPGEPEAASAREATLDVLGELWLAGLDIDWARHHRDQPRRRVPLPTYHFDRRRYVLAALARRDADPASPAARLWAGVGEAMASEAEAVCRAIDRERRDAEDAALSALALHDMMQALVELGALPDDGTGASPDAVATRGGVVERYRPLVRGWLELLAHAGHLALDRAGQLAVVRPGQQRTRDELARQVAALWADAPQVIDLLGRCGAALVPVLRGTTDATEVFENVLDSSEQTSQGEVAVRTYYTQILQAGVARLVSALPPRASLRVLEIGGGSGIATTALLPLLLAERTEYHFTDIARLFLSQARRKFSGYPFMSFGTLNIEVPPAEQGYAARTFDVIVAVNVLHAVGSITTTLRHVRSLLAPGGVLLVAELTRPTADFAMTYGLLMNRVDDPWRDPANPFLSPARWKAVLAETGFAAAAAFPDSDALDQHVIVAQAAADGSGASAFAAAAPTSTASASAPSGLAKRQDPMDWFYARSWRRTAPPSLAGGAAARWLVFAPAAGPGRALASALAQAGHDVIPAVAGASFARDAEGYTIDPGCPESYTALLTDLRDRGGVPHRIAHAWCAGPAAGGLDLASVEAAQAAGIRSLMFLGQAIGALEIVDSITLWIVSAGVHGLADGDVVVGRAPVLAAAKVIPLEYPNVACASLDLDTVDDAPAPALLAQLVDELQAEPADRVIAYRGRQRWVPGVEPIRVRGRRAHRRLKPRGAYLVTGGLGKIGLVVAEHLARAVQARLILVGRSAFPAATAWDAWLAAHDRDEPTSRTIAQLRALAALGAEVAIERADVTSLDDMRGVVDRAQQRWGAIDGVVHSAGVLGDGVIQHKTVAELDAVLAPKVTGTLVLDELFRDRPLDFFLVFSSLSAQMPAFGQLAYCAANNFLEQYTAHRLGDAGRFTACISWDVWQGDGMAYHATGPAALRALKEADFARRGILPAEGAAVLGWVLEGDLSHVLISTSDYLAVAEARAHDFAQVYLDELKAAATARHRRPELPTTYVRPRTDSEVTLAEIWEELLGTSGIGVDDDFFELGGDSLIGTQLMTRIKRACGVKLSTKVLYAQPTIRRLAAAVEEAIVAQASDEAIRLALEQLEQAK